MRFSHCFFSFMTDWLLPVASHFLLHKFSIIIPIFNVISNRDQFWIQMYLLHTWILPCRRKYKFKVTHIFSFSISLHGSLPSSTSTNLHIYIIIWVTYGVAIVAFIPSHGCKKNNKAHIVIIEASKEVITFHHCLFLKRIIHDTNKAINDRRKIKA